MSIRLNTHLFAAAATTALFTTGASAAVVTNLSGATVTSLDVDRGSTVYNYDTSELINVELTAFGGNSSGSSDLYFAVPDGSDLTVPAPGTRAGLVEDFDLSTGLLNLNGASTFSFDSAVVNDTGTDIVIYDIGGGDDVTLSVPGGTSTIVNPTFVDAGVGNVSSVLRGLAADADTLTELETIAKNGATTGNSNPRAYYEVDLSTFEIADGASVSSITLTGEGNIDPVLIVGLPAIPEPASVALLGLGGLCLLGRRRTA
jgi:hypothetical protein